MSRKLSSNAKSITLDMKSSLRCQQKVFARKRREKRINHANAWGGNKKEKWTRLLWPQTLSRRPDKNQLKTEDLGECILDGNNEDKVCFVVTCISLCVSKRVSLPIETSLRWNEQWWSRRWHVPNIQSITNTQRQSRMRRWWMPKLQHKRESAAVI